MNEIYTTRTCGWCQRAKLLLDKHGIEYHEIDVSTDRKLQQEMISRTHKQTVPQIFLASQHIGGYDDLVRHLAGDAASAA
jgi:GrxC family glutaredoxin